MKKAILIIFAILFSYSCIFASIKATVEVTKAFNQKFPNAASVKWNKENNHEFEANFIWNGSKYSANFSDKGEWLETESTIEFNQLPEKVQQSFNLKHKTQKIKAVAKIETSKGKVEYEIEIREKSKTKEKYYNSTGIEIKKLD